MQKTQGNCQNLGSWYNEIMDMYADDIRLKLKHVLMGEENGDCDKCSQVSCSFVYISVHINMHAAKITLG
jgi:hypothetical protein